MYDCLFNFLAYSKEKLSKRSILAPQGDVCDNVQLMKVQRCNACAIAKVPLLHVCIKYTIGKHIEKHEVLYVKPSAVLPLRDVYHPVQ